MERRRSGPDDGTLRQLRDEIARLGQ